MSIRELLKSPPPKDVIRLVLLRQGEADAAPGLIVGDADLALSQRGREQIETARRRLGQAPLTAVYAADLKRAAGSARLLVEGRAPAPAVVEVAALREQHLGDWQGKTWDALRAASHQAVEAFFADQAERRAPGGESLSEVKRRVLAWWKTRAAQHRGGQVLAATALAPIRAFLSEALELPLSRAPRLTPGPGTLTVLDAGPSFWVVHAVGA
jgi:alpha-ribazole phosphatase